MSKPIFTPESFLAFVESKDPNETYSYTDAINCACAQYCRSIGLDYKEQSVREKCINAHLEAYASYAAHNYSMEDGRANLYNPICSFGYLAEYIYGCLEKPHVVVEKPPRLFHALWC